MQIAESIKTETDGEHPSRSQNNPLR